MGCQFNNNILLMNNIAALSWWFCTRYSSKTTNLHNTWKYMYMYCILQVHTIVSRQQQHNISLVSVSQWNVDTHIHTQAHANMRDVYATLHAHACTHTHSHTHGWMRLSHSLTKNFVACCRPTQPSYLVITMTSNFVLRDMGLRKLSSNQPPAYTWGYVVHTHNTGTHSLHGVHSQ